jgi:putative membrane protein insertion efficiency factor
MFEFLYKIPRNFTVFLIKIYQKTISLDHGILKIFYPNGYCRFYPTCSEYGVQAITKYGIIKGGLMTSWRILRCNPWSKGGSDPVK